MPAAPSGPVPAPFIRPVLSPAPIIRYDKAMARKLAKEKKDSDAKLAAAALVQVTAARATFARP